MLACAFQSLAYNAGSVARPAQSGVARSQVLMQEKSKAIPFLNAPPALDGTMPGDKGFDPLLLSNTVPLAWSREAELKHARVCMLAVVGYVSVDLGFRVPYAPEVGSLAAHDAAIEKGPMFGLFVVISLFEIVTGIPKVFQLMNDPDAAPPGDYKFDPLGFGGSPDLQEKELSNGRLAMMAFSGIVTQSVLTGAAGTGGGFPYTYNGAVDFIPPLAPVNPIDAFGICSSGIINGCQ